MPMNSVRNNFSFAEVPVTLPEVAVAGVIKELYSAMVDKDKKRVLSLFSEDAEFIIWPKSTNGSRGGFSSFLDKNIADLLCVRFDNVVIRVKDKETSVVYAVVLYRYVREFIGPADKYWELKEVNGTWLIVKSGWY